MGKPHLLRLRFRTDVGGLRHHHMLILLCIVQLLLLAVHSLADKKIRIRRHLGDHRGGTGIRTVGDGEATACRAHDHVRGIGHPVFHHCFAVLETIPAAKRDPLCLCAGSVKLSEPVNADTIAVAGDFMIYLKGIQHKRAERELLYRLRKLVIDDFKGKLRRHDAKTIHHAL